jgi:hypothetical protein
MHPAHTLGYVQHCMGMCREGQDVWTAKCHSGGLRCRAGHRGMGMACQAVEWVTVWWSPEMGAQQEGWQKSKHG